MSKKPKDQHPDVPAEANRDNHVHFLAGERSDTALPDDGSVGRLS